MNNDVYPEVRDLDGYYFRVQRDGKWVALCFTDLTYKEQVEMTQERSAEWLQSLAIGMAGIVRYMGEAFDLVSEDVE